MSLDWKIMLSALLAVLASSGVRAQQGLPSDLEVTGTAQAITGDLITINNLDIRLYGIDAPEIGQTCWNVRGVAYDCGIGARNMMTRILNDRTLHCVIFAERQDGAAIGTCRLDTEEGTDLGRVMVLIGWAFADRALSDRYDRSEGVAQADRAGVWSGRAQRPSIWRNERREEELERRLGG